MIDVIPDYSEAKPRLVQVGPTMVLNIDPEYEAAREAFARPLIEQYGAKWDNSQPYPTELPQGAPGQCFQNAMEMALSVGWVYCEGWMVFDHPDYERIAMPHAWVVDKNGCVLDPSAPTAQNLDFITYVGIAIRMNYLVGQYYATGHFGVLDGDPVEGKKLGIHATDPAQWLIPKEKFNLKEKQ